MRSGDDGIRQQRALKSQMEQQQMQQEMQAHHAHTWTAAHHHMEKVSADTHLSCLVIMIV
jgi:hypothetical protein